MRDRVLLLLEGSPQPLSARQIAEKLHSSKKEVNSALYSFRSAGLVQQIWHSGETATFWRPVQRTSSFPDEMQPLPRPRCQSLQQTTGASARNCLYPWQEEAFGKWRDNGYRGMLEAVTGSGKTRFALEATKRLREAIAQRLYVLIVVPTITLMDQWFDEGTKFFGNDQPNQVGRLGDGHPDDFSKVGRWLIIAVANSAANHVNDLLGFTQVRNAKTLLIADEVHRLLYAEQRGRVLDFPFTYTLGMSATLSRETDPRLGRRFYLFTFEDAKREGIVPTFDLVQVSVSLNDQERGRYKNLTERIQNQIKWAKDRYSRELANLDHNVEEGRLLRELGWIYRRNSDPQIERLFGLVFRRSAISHECEQKLDLATKLGAFLMRRPGRGKRIFFFERIESAELAKETMVENNSVADSWKEIARRLHKYAPHAWCKTMQSGLKRPERRQILEEFRNLPSATLLCCRMLDEGLNVPEIDVAVLVSSSQTKRQRIQRIGRALRTIPNGKRPLIISFHVSETTDARTIRHDKELFSEVAEIYREDAGTFLSRVEGLLARL